MIRHTLPPDPGHVAMPGFNASRLAVNKIETVYDKKFGRMWEFYLISAEMMFRTGSQLVFHMQLARKRDAVPIVRDYIVDCEEFAPSGFQAI